MLVVDVEFKEVVFEPVVKVKVIHDLGIKSGFPYRIHAPANLLRLFSEDELVQLGQNGMTMDERKPLFLRTEQKFHRYCFANGDAASALFVLGRLRGKRLVFKNWL